MKDNPEIVEKLENQIYFHTYFATDTAMLSVLGMEVEWFNRDVDHNSCLLICEKRYKQLEDFGLLNKNTLTICAEADGKYGVTLPIAGIIKNIPYDTFHDGLVAIYPGWEGGSEFLAVPKPGKHNSLVRGIKKVISQIAPEDMNEKVYNYRNVYSPFYVLVEAFGAGGMILGAVSLIICAMTIFSAVALDTRARRKEVAVRKVNGAKSLDIYRLFGRVYLVIIAISLVIAVPLCVIFNRLIVHLIGKVTYNDVDLSSTLSPVWPIILGILIVIALVLLIVGWQIHRVMQTDPAKVIAKE